MINDLLIGLFLSVFLGSLVGAQREMKQQKEHYQDFAGFRTFTFISLFGFLLGFMAFEILNSSALILIGVLGVFALVAISYYTLSSKFGKYVSMTSQIAALLTFMVGLLVSLKLYQVSIIVAVVVVGFLVLGTALHKFAKRITNNEVFATLQFIIISLVVLPLLPNKNYGPLDIPGLDDFWQSQILISIETLAAFSIFNFYHIWLMVVFVSGITYVGYILMKLLGKKGILLTGILGGLMSSTALTSSFSIESKKWKDLSNPLAVGIILASSIMFFRIILEVFIVNPGLVFRVAFLSIMGFIGIIFALFYYSKKEKTVAGDYKTESPFALGPALKFGAFFVVIVFISKLFTLAFGDKGIYLIALFSGVVDVDVVTLTFSRLALEGIITDGAAAGGIFIAAISNTVFKGGIAYYLANRDVSKKVITSFLVIVVTGFTALALL